MMMVYFKGDSVKTDRYRCNEWRRKNGDVYARMLYDHSVDWVENMNIFERPENKKVVKKMSKIIQGLKQ